MSNHEQEMLEVSFDDNTYQLECALADTGADERYAASSPETAVARSEAEVIVTKALNRLTPREQSIIVKRFWGDLDQREISKIYGMTYANIDKIEAQAFDKLRQHLSRDLF
ncbi:MAG: sigma-70 family RNA polymerase sigma factor [Patescibacteria group bacterium]